MAVSSDLLIKIQADTKQAVVKISEIEKRLSDLGRAGSASSEAFGGFASSIGKAGGAAVVLNQAVDLARKGFDLMNGVLGETVTRYYRSVDGLNKLEASLRLTGTKRAREVAISFQKMGEEIERSTTFQADQVISLATTAKVMGLSDDMARKLIKTSADLSAATGRDLAGSFQVLSQSLKGNARGLSEVDPRLTKMSEANLRAGKAVDFLAERLKGFSDAQARSFMGQMTQVKNAVEGISQTIGEIISKGLRLDDNAARFKDFVISLKGAVESIRPSAIAFIRVFTDADWKSIAIGALEVGASFIALKAAVFGIDFIGAIRAIGGVSSAISAMGGTTVIITSMTAALKVFAISAWAAMAPFLSAAGTVAAVLGIAAAIDIMVRNWGKLKNVMSIVVDLFDVLGKTGGMAFVWISEKLTQLTLLFTQFVAFVTRIDLSGLMNPLNRGVDQARNRMEAMSKEVDNLFAGIKEKSSKVDFGFSGAIAGAAKSAIKSFGAKPETPSQNERVGGANKSPVLGLSDSQMTAVLNYRKQSIQLQQQINSLGADEISMMDEKLDLTLREMEMMQDEFRRKEGNVKEIEDAYAAALSKVKELAAAEKRLAIFNGVGVGRFVSDLKNTTAPSFEAMKSGASQLGGLAPDSISEPIKGAISSIDFSSIVSPLKDAFSGVIGQAASMAGQFLSGVSDVALGVISMALQAPQLILGAVTNLGNAIQGLMDFPIKLIDALGNLDQIMSRFIERFPDAVSKLADKLPDLLKSIISKIPAFIKALVERIPELVSAFTEAIPVMVAMLVKQAPQIAITMARAFIRLIFMQIKAFFDGIGKLLSGKGFKMPKVIDADVAAKDIKRIARQLTEEASKVFAVLDFTEGGKRADTVVAKVEAAAKKTKDQLDQMWRNVEIGTQRFFDSAGKFLEGIGPAFATAWSGLEQAIGPFFEGIGNMVTSAFSTVGQTVWNGLQSAFSGLGNLITDIINNLNPESLLKKVFALSGDWGGGRGDVEKLLGIDVPFVAFAEGGIVPGQSKVPGDSPLNDRILAMLSPGEAVIPRSVMAKPGMKDLVDQVLSGSLPALALSGGLKKVTSAVASAVANPFADVWEGLSQAAQDAASAVQSVLTVGLDAIQQAASLMGVPVEMLIGEVSKKASGGLKAMISSNASQAIGFASGGVVPGSGYGDSVPAMLTPGEFVINRRAVQSIGLPALEAINAGKSGGQGTVTVNQSFDVSIETSEKLDEAFIRTKLVPALKKELKRASLDGQFVIAASGVRS